jgi:hypothetical protein
LLRSLIMYSSNFCSSMSFCFTCFDTDVRCIHNKNQYIFLENWYSCHYIIPFSFSENFPCSEVYYV